ncbi:hypothetical protein ACGF0D_43050 [Kitasatospora sp. NPDC048298]|uniref:hypothetical protein n=1 Tax=Kitasatospora sp. NPDC048298 TaxID=3364049 RepID=UPI00371C50F3
MHDDHDELLDEQDQEKAAVAAKVWAALGAAVKAAMVPVKAVLDGSPVLTRRLSGLGADTREKAARLKELELQALQGEWQKLDEPQRLAAELAHRKARRGKTADAVVFGVVIAVFVLAVFGSLLRWVLVLVLVAWTIGAMAHSPSSVPEVEDQAVEDVDRGEEPDDVEDDQEPVAKPAPRPLTAPELVATIEHMVAIRATKDGGAGNVLIGEVLTALQRHRQFEGYDTREFGAAVRAAGMKPKPSVGVGSGASRKTSPGWTVEYLHATLGRVPALPPQAAVDRTPVEAA